MIANNKSKIRLSWCNYLNLNSTSILDGDENAEAKKCKNRKGEYKLHELHNFKTSDK